MASLSDNNEIINKTAFFGALCLFFATLEYLFPRPVPFFRLGLANLPILLAIEVLPFPYLLLLGLLKVLGQGLIHGTLASYVVLFSFCGTFSSLFVMYGAKRMPGLSYLGVSVLGAMVSNTVQVGLSLLLVFGTNAALIIPYFFTLGLVSGAGIGVFANWFSSGSAWYAAQRGETVPAVTGRENATVQASGDAPVKKGRKKRKDRLAGLLLPGQRFFLGLGLLIPLVFQDALYLRILHVTLLAILCVLAGKRLSWLYFINLIFWITLFQQLSPFGKVLAQIGPFSVTRGALEAGIGKSFLLIGLVFTSLFSVTPGLRLPGKLGGIVGRMFFYFEELYQGKHRIRRKTFLKDVDQLLHEAGTQPLDRDAEIPAAVPLSREGDLQKKKTGLVCVAIVLIVFYSVWAAGFLHLFQ